MSGPGKLLVALYRNVLVIYPSRLRVEYQEQMLQTLRDDWADHRQQPLRFWFRAFFDLVKSSLMERLYMLSEQGFQRPLIFHTLALGVIISVLGGIAALTMQNLLRGGANQPQIDMLESYTREIATAPDPGKVLPAEHVDVKQSLQPFLIFYNDQGRPDAGNGYLNQKLPVPPAGVFDFVRTAGLEKVTWQPQPGVRLASVVRRVDGRKPGFLLAARSLRVVEQQESVLWWMTLVIWVVVMALLFAGASLLNRAQRMKTA
jgi:hypothetical protein